MSDEREQDQDQEDWDLDESWEVVSTVGTDEEANILAGYLRAHQVSAQVESLRFHQEPVNFGGLGEVRVRVPMEQREQALRLLSDREVVDLSAEAEVAERATEAGGPEGGAAQQAAVRDGEREG
jgi:hypothetical protein